MMMKRLLPWILLAAGGFVSVDQTLTTAKAMSDAPIVAQADGEENGLSYTFYDQQIALVERSDQIAVEFKPAPSSTRGDSEPAYLRLQRDLTTAASLSRSAQPTADITVKPLGERYALVELPANFDEQWAQRLSQSYIQATLPVLSREGGTESIVVTQEMVVSVEPGVSDGEVRRLLSQYGVEVIRPLRFGQGRYLVRATNVSGTAVLAAATQLGNLPSIQSATPNFVQSIPFNVAPLDVLSAETPQRTNGLDHVPAAEESSPFPQSLLPLQWHLNSRAMRPRPYPRSDVRAVEAWKTTQGDNVVVAVIDSLIQWDHPDLVDQIYAVPQDVADWLPGETHGWDFSNGEVTCAPDDSENCALGDGDTRISTDELDYLRPHLQRTFTLEDADLLAAYPWLAGFIAQVQPTFSEKQRADYLRQIIQSEIGSEFHGTWSAGVIAANPADRQGVVGVAPAAQILPVRVFGLGGEITSAALIEAIGYAAARDVDVINMSLGGLLPDQALSDQVFRILDAYPDLVIVASAGNDQLDGVSFPAALPGVISVGATNVQGNRSYYSSYGAGLDLVAPGGETNQQQSGGILTAGGTWVSGFWQGVERPQVSWGSTLDPVGLYVQVQGTSFAAPTVSGVLALMRSVDGAEQLDRDELTAILGQTADYGPLVLSQADENQYRLQASAGFGTAGDFPFVRPSGISGPVEAIAPEVYFFGQGLVDAVEAVKAVAEVVEERG
ncbi:S8 family serine peptidase [Leptothoe sp. PORK10 BA2]|uniref:S8 family serine peptidase n=1 Tax=Leptothoe sp. PORK10 BA2 TaxID=3110254 RepID=UPI002B1FD952|nr:S8 family serine peptidase [Leptothoe sp. PORK10 BA2]MEA5464587.1 S8 family serine peptidase [Leptothoe sp. PORK10 BA2]